MDYDDIRGLAKHHKQVFGRIVQSEMYRLKDGRVLAVTRLHDAYHDMELAFLLSDALCILEVSGKMERIPYPCCGTKPLEVLAGLKGISVLERGGMKKVRERIPRDLGCTHVYEMIEATFRAIFVGAYSVLHEDWMEVLDLCHEEHRQLGIQSPIFAGSCYAFNPGTADPEAYARAQRKIEASQREKEAFESFRKGNVAPAGTPRDGEAL